MSMDFDKMHALPGTTQEEFGRIKEGILAMATSETGVASIPENVCVMCMRPAGIAPEIVRVEVSYDCTFMRTRLCLDCKSRLNTTLNKALAELGLH
jgi:hypothetical protein